MFKRTPKVVTAKLDEVMDRLLKDMDTYGPDSPEYPTMLGHLERVVVLRKSEDRQKIDPNSMAIVAGNLLGILIIVAYEQKHVMTSKAIGFVLKSRS